MRPPPPSLALIMCIDFQIQPASSHNHTSRVLDVKLPFSTPSLITAPGPCSCGTTPPSSSVNGRTASHSLALMFNRCVWSVRPSSPLRSGCCIMNVPASLSSHGSSLYSHEWQSGGFGEAPSLVQQHVGAWLLGCCLHMFVWSARWAPVHFT